MCLWLMGNVFLSNGKVFKKLRKKKDDQNLAYAPKTDENNYYGLYYR